MSLSFQPTDLLERARQVVADESAAVLSAADSIDEKFVAVAQLLLSCSGKILITGSGTSGAVARRAAHLFSVGGTPSFYLSPDEGLHGGLGVLRQNDLIIAISKGGASAELNLFCRRGRVLSAALIAITAAPASELAQLADHVLELHLPTNADLGAVVATGSSLACAALLDALVEVTRAARGYSWSDLLFTHPSGAVGKNAAAALERLEREGR
ncbi:MAG TPA: SIS domain-containing protein [Chthoniobacterales bacterium]